MDYTKLPQEIFNAEQNNLQKLAALFPAAVKDGLLDIAALKEELGQFEEVTAERYELNWAGKRDAKKASQSDVAGRTLKCIPEDSKNPDTTENLYIEGDNLEVLKLLRQNYYGAVKMIYIDPPYNTGNDFVYRDDFSQSKAESDEAEGETVDGERMVVNQKSGNRFHANWLNMMYPRLRVAKDLLCEDGVIFISIDDNEVAQLRKICDEIFGEMNFLAQIVWEKRFTRSNNARMFASLTDYVFVYRKSESVSYLRAPRTEKSDSIYSNPDNDPRGVWTSVSYVNPATKEQRPNLTYTIDNPFTGQKISHPTNAWKYEYERHQNNVAENRLYWGANGENTYPRLKKFLTEVEDGMVPVNLWKREDVGTTDAASKDLNNLMEAKVFDFPKPPELIKEMIQIAALDGNSIVLDFFSGSATTAHAVMQLNAEDGGNRKFVMVQYPEVCNEKSEAAKAGYSTICEIGKERIRRAGEKIKAEVEAANAQVKLGEEPKQVPDIGFRVFRTADTNIRWTHEAVMGQLELDERILSDKDRLDFMPGYTDIDVVYEVLLRQRDIPLSAKVEKLGIGQRTYMFADAYVVCLDEKVTVELVEALAAVEPTPIKYVFRDSAFDDNISLKDETVRQLEAYIARNSGEQKKAYTVEFI